MACIAKIAKLRTFSSLVSPVFFSVKFLGFWSTVLVNQPTMHIEDKLTVVGSVAVTLGVDDRLQVTRDP